MSNIGYMSAWQSSDTPCCPRSPGWTSPTGQQGQISLFYPPKNIKSLVKWPKITTHHVTRIKLLHRWENLTKNEKLVIIDSQNKERYSTLPSSWWLWRPVLSCPPRPCQSVRPRQRGHQAPSAYRPGPGPWDTCFHEKLGQTIPVGKAIAMMFLVTLAYFRLNSECKYFMAIPYHAFHTILYHTIPYLEALL